MDTMISTFPMAAMTRTRVTLGSASVPAGNAGNASAAAASWHGIALGTTFGTANGDVRVEKAAAPAVPAGAPAVVTAAALRNELGRKQGRPPRGEPR